MTASVPPEAWAVALAGLPDMGSARLLALLRRWEPCEAWHRIIDRSWLHAPEFSLAARGDASRLADGWVAAAPRVDVVDTWRRHVDAGVGVMSLRSSAYPPTLLDDIDPPAVLFLRGDPMAIAGPRVAIVGTRTATQYGRDLAFELGRELAAAGVAIISGLALGIDGAAHAGALEAETSPPIAVVGSGLDVVYPRRHAVLWREVERRGVVLGEAPLGAAPERWRFPPRNRIIAALADVVVVIESREAGGSMHTVAEAQLRDRPVFAAPGPVRSPTSTGTNKLLSEGANVVRDAGDILLALGLSSALTRTLRDTRPVPSKDDAAVLDAVGWSPISLGVLADRIACPLGELALALSRLCDQGWLAERGGWYERVARSEP